MNPLQFALNLPHSLFFLAIGVLGIGFLIGFHELGHFLFCKLFKIRTPTFSIGMGPRIWHKKVGDTEFTLSALPFGGYVEIAGSAEQFQGEQQEAYATDAGSFAPRPYYQKMLVMAGGILFNLLFVYIALSFLYFVGMPSFPLLYPLHASTHVSVVEESSPAATGGILVNDQITALNSTPVTTATDIVKYIQAHPEETVNVSLQRNGTEKTVAVQLGAKETSTNEKIGFLGVVFDIPRVGLLRSIQQGITATHHMIYQVALSFKNIFAKKQFDALGGPLMIISQTAKSAQKGFKFFLLLLSFISVNLALLNLLPVPVMDGGQALQYTIEALVGRPLPEKLRTYLHLGTWFLLLGLIIYLSIKDILMLCIPNFSFKNLLQLFKKN
jgi:regulator of sigma E protease